MIWVVFSKILPSKPKPQSDSIRTWDTEEVIRCQWGSRGGPCDGISGLTRRDTGASPPCVVRTQQGGDHLQARKRALARTRPCWHPDLRFPTQRRCEKLILLFKPPSLWDSAMTARTDHVNILKCLLMAQCFHTPLKVLIYKNLCAVMHNPWINSTKSQFNVLIVTLSP